MISSRASLRISKGKKRWDLTYVEHHQSGNSGYAVRMKIEWQWCSEVNASLRVWPRQLTGSTSAENWSGNLLKLTLEFHPCSQWSGGLRGTTQSSLGLLSHLPVPHSDPFWYWLQGTNPKVISETLLLFAIGIPLSENLIWLNVFILSSSCNLSDLWTPADAHTEEVSVCLYPCTLFASDIHGYEQTHTWFVDWFINRALLTKCPTHPSRRRGRRFSFSTSRIRKPSKDISEDMK